MKPKLRRAARALVALPAAAFLSGCFRYLPVEMGAVPPDSELRVFMSRGGLADIPGEIPVSATYVNGRFVRQTQDSILIQVAVSRRLDAPGAMDLRQNVYLATDQIVALQRRELHRARTIVAVLGGGALAAALVGFIVDAGGNPMDDPASLPQQQGRVPLLRLPAP